MVQVVQVVQGCTELNIFKIFRSEDVWDLDKLLHGLPPLPKFKAKCPFCGYEQYCIKHYYMFKYDNQYRVDVWFKCLRCKHVWVCGIPISEELFKKALPYTRQGMRRWLEYGHICFDGEKWIRCDLQWIQCQVL